MFDTVLVFIGLGLFILQVPLAGVLMVITFMGGFIPIVGAFVAGALAVLIALVSNGLTTALNWLSWIVIILGVAGFLVSAGTLAFAALTGREFNSGKGLFLSIIVCILAVSAGVILQTFI